MVADLAATFATVIASVADVKHQEGYELGLAAARSRQAPSGLRLVTT